MREEELGACILCCVGEFDFELLHHRSNCCDDFLGGPKLSILPELNQRLKRVWSERVDTAKGASNQ